VATIKVREVIGRVEDVLNDANVRWPRLELQEWLNEAYRVIVMLRPDANAKSGTFTCAAGTRQDVTTGFSGALRVLDVVRNLASSSNKKAVRFIQRKLLDDHRPGWHGETQTVNIEFYAFDARQPKHFFVYPPASTSAQLEVVYSELPAVHALAEAALDPDGADTTVINLDDIYEPMIVDWILYRAFSKDAESSTNAARAQAAFQTFTAGVGSKSQVDSAADPASASA